MNNSEKRNNNVRSNFGAKGWWIIIFSALNWMFYGGLVTVSMNTVVPQLAPRIGTEAGTLLAMSTPAGIAALFVCLFAGKIIEKKGVKLVNGISLIIAAFAVFIWAQSKSVLSYTISLLFVVCSLNVCQLAAGNTAISNWFPKKKGLAIGWATMGLNFASAFFVVILVKLSGIFGDIKYALWIMSGCLIILSIINFTAFVDYPEQWGAFPDNNPNETRRTDNTLHTRWTTKLVLKQKETWTIGIINGIYAMGTIGFVSTLVMSMMMKGYTQPQAIKFLSISAIIGILGSYLCGYIDQKLGVNKASIIFGCWVIMGICFYFVPGNIGTWIYIVTLGLSIGASNNFPPSMTAQVYGRDGMAVAFPIIFFIKGIISVLCYTILGISQNMYGNYNVAWIIFAVLTAVAIILTLITKFDLKEEPKEEN